MRSYRIALGCVVVLVAAGSCDSAPSSSPVAVTVLAASTPTSAPAVATSTTEPPPSDPRVVTRAAGSIFDVLARGKFTQLLPNEPEASPFALGPDGEALNFRPLPNQQLLVELVPLGAQVGTEIKVIPNRTDVLGATESGALAYSVAPWGGDDDAIWDGWELWYQPAGGVPSLVAEHKAGEHPMGVPVQPVFWNESLIWEESRYDATGRGHIDIRRLTFADGTISTLIENAANPQGAGEDLVVLANLTPERDIDPDLKLVRFGPDLTQSEVSLPAKPSFAAASDGSVMTIELLDADTGAIQINFLDPSGDVTSIRRDLNYPEFAVGGDGFFAWTEGNQAMMWLTGSKTLYQLSRYENTSDVHVAGSRVMWRDFALDKPADEDGRPEFWQADVSSLVGASG